MGYGRPLKNPGSKGETPEGRTSWQDAQNQVKGNLRWALSFLNPDELIAKLVEVLHQDLRRKNFSCLRKRIKFLRELREFHAKMIEKIDEEIDRTQQMMASRDESEYLELENPANRDEVNRKWRS